MCSACETRDKEFATILPLLRGPPVIEVKQDGIEPRRGDPDRVPTPIIVAWALLGSDEAAVKVEAPAAGTS